MTGIYFQRIMAALLLCFCVFNGYSGVVSAEKAPIEIINHRGSNKEPKYIYLERTELPEYNQYTNSRFGFSAYIPAEMNACFLPQNGDGVTFTNNDGASVIISGMHNVLCKTLQEEFEEALKKYHSVVYKACGDEWYVISHYNELKDIIYYEKHFVNKDYLNTLCIYYPRSESEHYKPMVAVIEEYFVPGWLKRQ